MQRRQAAKAAKDQLIRWKREQRREARREGEDAKRKARSQGHEIRSTLESFLFWFSFVFFRVIRIMSAAAQEAFRKEVDKTLPRRTIAGQNRRRYRDPAAAVKDEDSVLSQGDTPSGVKKQVPSVRDTAVQADLPQRSCRTDDPQQTKDESRKDHLQAPKEALNASHDQQPTA